MDRRDVQIDKLIAAAERIARAQERQVEMLEEEMKKEVEMEGALPSECPFCGAQNPTVTQLKLGSGPVDEFVLAGETHCCNKVVYGVPVQMLIAPNTDVASEMLKVKKGGTNDTP